MNELDEVFFFFLFLFTCIFNMLLNILCNQKESCYKRQRYRKYLMTLKNIHRMLLYSKQVTKQYIQFTLIDAYRKTEG